MSCRARSRCSSTDNARARTGLTLLSGPRPAVGQTSARRPKPRSHGGSTASVGERRYHIAKPACPCLPKI